jgi:hypothetical protein
MFPGIPGQPTREATVRTMQPTGIAVSRAADYFAVARSIRVIVDEGEMGVVPYGQRRVFLLEPGVYSVEVEMDWCCSAPFEVRLREGEIVELEAGLRWRGLLWSLSLPASFVAPGRVLVVRPAPEPSHSPVLRAVGELLLAAVSCTILFCLPFALACLVLLLL